MIRFNLRAYGKNQAIVNQIYVTRTDDLMGKPFTLLDEIFETRSILQKLWNESPFNFSFLSKTQLI